MPKLILPSRRLWTPRQQLRSRRLFSSHPRRNVRWCPVHKRLATVVDAAGDVLLDADGNVILDDDGNVKLSNGTGDECCCGEGCTGPTCLFSWIWDSHTNTVTQETIWCTTHIPTLDKWITYTPETPDAYCHARLYKKGPCCATAGETGPCGDWPAAPTGPSTCPPGSNCGVYTGGPWQVTLAGAVPICDPNGGDMKGVGSISGSWTSGESATITPLGTVELHGDSACETPYFIDDVVITPGDARITVGAAGADVPSDYPPGFVAREVEIIQPISTDWIGDFDTYIFKGTCVGPQDPDYCFDAPFLIGTDAGVETGIECWNGGTVTLSLLT